MSKIFNQVFHVNGEYPLREEKLGDVNHLVVPVIMIKEGVHHGSGGRLFHPAEELSKYVDTWNGSPVIIDHVWDEKGMPLSANSVKGDATRVGRVYNAVWEEESKSLKAEAWLETSRLEKLSPQVNAIIRAKKALDVSVGAYSRDEMVKGTWNDSEYDGIARDYRPDHLALLPDDVGACSWKDGCGIRANKENKMETVKLIDKVFDENAEEQEVLTLVHVNVDMKKRLTSVQSALRGMDSEKRWHYVEQLHSKYLIYKVDIMGAPMEWFRQDYTYDEKSGDVAFSGVPTQMYKKTTFSAKPIVNIGNEEEDEEGTLNTNKAGGADNMADKTCTCSEDKVNALVEAGIFSEADKEKLQALDEAVADKIIVYSQSKSQPDTNTQDKDVQELTPEKAMEVLSALGDEKLMKVLPKDVQMQINKAKERDARQKAGLIEILKAKPNVLTVYSEEVLQSKTLEELEDLHKITGGEAQAPTDYSALGINRQNGGVVEPLAIPGAAQKAS